MLTHTPSRRSLRIAGFVTAACAAVALAAPASATPIASHSAHHGQDYSWIPRPTGVQEQFRGLAAVSDRVAWVSGEKGSVLRTTDGGRSWTDVSPEAAKSAGLALRDIEATDSRHAEALSIGNGTDSRIFRTDDGGKTWQQVFTNTDPNAFYDCMAFSSHGIGLAMSDPVDGYFRMARTTDGGKTWSVLPTTGMPKAFPNEFGFAASGTCLVSAQGRFTRPGEFWFATGGQSPRVFHTTNAGNSWTAETTPVRAGDSAGIYSIAFKNSWTGVAVGGDYTAPTDGNNAAATKFAWFPWKASSNALGGYRSGVAYVPGGWGGSVIAVGPTGSDVSTNGGRTWSTFDTTDYDGIHSSAGGACWASGPNGAVAVLKIDHSYWSSK